MPSEDEDIRVEAVNVSELEDDLKAAANQRRTDDMRGHVNAILDGLREGDYRV